MAPHSMVLKWLSLAGEDPPPPPPSAAILTPALYAASVSKAAALATVKGERGEEGEGEEGKKEEEEEEELPAALLEEKEVAAVGVDIVLLMGR